MEPLALPNKIDIVPHDEFSATVTIEPCYPGYGMTLGNSLRRVLLSSLPGAAVTAVKMKGVAHEFTAPEKVKEDMVAIILNLKKVRFRLTGDEAVTLSLKKKGQGAVTAGDFGKHASAEAINVDQPIATITEAGGEVDLEVTVSPGRGYLPVEAREKEKLDIGTIAVDAVFTPIRVVNFRVENVRVGQMTNFDRLTIDINTDGSITPQEAFTQSAKLLVDHFQLLTQSAPAVSGETSIPKKKRGRPRKTEVAPVETSGAQAPDAPEETT